MARYIDADLIEYHDSFTNDGEYARVAFGDDIDVLPTAEVVEVVHGKNISKSGFLCSVCKFGDFDGFYGYEPNFCPNCGADMRGGQNELHKRL